MKITTKTKGANTFELILLSNNEFADSNYSFYSNILMVVYNILNINTKMKLSLIKLCKNIYNFFFIILTGDYTAL